MDDLRIRKRARKGDMIADLDKGDKITGSISIYEGGVRVRYEDGTLETIHSNNLYLDDPE